MYLGSFIIGVVLSVAGYYSITWLWRTNIRKKWKKRSEARISSEKKEDQKNT